MKRDRKVLFYKTDTMADLERAEKEKFRLEQAAYKLVETVHGFYTGFFVYER